MENTTLKPISLTTQTHQPLPKAKRSQAKPPRSAAALRSLGNEANRLEELLEQYGCGPVQFSGSGNASYERHLIFDNVIRRQPPSRANVSRRWPARCATSCLNAGSAPKNTTPGKTPSAFTISRWSTWLGVRSPITSPISCSTPSSGKRQSRNILISWNSWNRSRTPGWAMAGWDVWRRAFWIPWPRMALPAMGYGLRYEYGIFKQTIKNGWQQEQPDNWLRNPDPWEVARPREKIEVPLNCSFEVRGGSLHPIPGRPSKLIGVPYDRPVVGFGGKTINTLRLWAATDSRFLRFPRIQPR